MVPGKNRAERRIIDALKNDPEITRIYSPNSIFQGYMVPNTLSALDSYVLVKRISSSVRGGGLIDGTESDNLRRVRVQIDVSDIRYSDMANKSEKIRGCLEAAYPSSIDGDTYGTVTIGQKVFNVTSIDVLMDELATDGD